MPDTAKRTNQEQKQLQRQLIGKLEELGGKLDNEDDIVFAGDKIIIPARMTLAQAWDFIGRRVQDEEQEYNLHRVFNYRPHDGARATARAVKELFGYTIGQKIPGTIFTPPVPPTLIDIDVDVDRQEQVPWNRLALPFLKDAYIDLDTHRHPEYGRVFALSATCKRRDRFAIEGLFRKIEDNLRSDSIYRGKAITATENPNFIDVSAVQFEDVVYTEQVMDDLMTYVWANILYPQALRDQNQLGKRVTIMYGEYGTGKTLAAYLTAKHCVNQMRDGGEPVTFIMCRPGLDSWQYAIQLARLYGRCVIFIEDADLLVDPTNPLNISAMLEQFDGLVTKGLDMSLVLTTNHIDKIHKGMLRPGRTDGLIEVGNMDRQGVERLAKRIIGDQLEPNINWDEVFAHCEGFTPAYIKEVLDRSVRRSIVRNNGQMGRISERDLIGAAENLKPQLKLMQDAPEVKERPKLEHSLGLVVRDEVERSLAGRQIDGFEGVSLAKEPTS